MIRRANLILVGAILGALTLSVSAFVGTYGGGSGAKADLIYTAEKMQDKQITARGFAETKRIAATEKRPVDWVDPLIDSANSR